jgi:hypothetical protein
MMTQADQDARFVLAVREGLETKLGRCMTEGEFALMKYELVSWLMRCERRTLH